MVCALWRPTSLKSAVWVGRVVTQGKADIAIQVLRLAVAEFFAAKGGGGQTFI